MERLLLLFMRGPRLCAAFFRTSSMCFDQMSRVSSVTPKITGVIDPMDWLPEELN
jgi:hypothetical protein